MDGATFCVICRQDVIHHNMPLLLLLLLVNARNSVEELCANAKCPFLSSFRATGLLFFEDRFNDTCTNAENGWCCFRKNVYVECKIKPGNDWRKRYLPTKYVGTSVCVCFVHSSFAITLKSVFQPCPL